MTDRKRLIALLLCAGMALSLLISSGYILLSAGHDCPGEGCHTCEAISRVEALLRVLVLLGAIFCLLYMLGKAAQAFSACREGCFLRSRTLVFWKVRLND